VRSAGFLGLLILSLAASGCGGGGGGDVSGSGTAGRLQLVSSYRTDFAPGSTGQNASIAVFVDLNGAAGVEIADVSGPLYAGTGRLESGKLTVNASGQSGTVTVNGTEEAGPPAAMVVTLSGAANVNSVTLPKISGAGAFPLAGSYSGTYSNTGNGNESGSISITVSNNGEVSGTLFSPSLGNLAMSGNVNLAGGINFNTTGTSVWNGSLFFPPGQNSLPNGTGTWNFSNGTGLQGNWSVIRSQ
jgi:hypothetical protein